ncbi:MAG: glutathione S-transferase family protein [Rhodospirillaceae bacterium]|nr:glutathione S-transferase family protein [Rhodospirillaceae bacterium]
MYEVYARAGWGSVLVEAALKLGGLPYDLVDVDIRGNPDDRRKLAAINPMVQLPTIVTPDGTVMTESGAILLCIAERARAGALAPPPDDPLRASYLRWQIYLVANIYASYMIDDAPARWAEGDVAQAAIKQRADAYRYDLLSILEQNAGAPWFLGERFSTIDLFVSVMSRWSPRRDWYKANSPKLYAIALAVDEIPALAEIWARNFGPGVED